MTKASPRETIQSYQSAPRTRQCRHHLRMTVIAEVAEVETPNAAKVVLATNRHSAMILILLMRHWLMASRPPPPYFDIFILIQLIFLVALWQIR